MDSKAQLSWNMNDHFLFVDIQSFCGCCCCCLYCCITSTTTPTTTAKAKQKRYSLKFSSLIGNKPRWVWSFIALAAFIIFLPKIPSSKIFQQFFQTKKMSLSGNFFLPKVCQSSTVAQLVEWSLPAPEGPSSYPIKYLEHENLSDNYNLKKMFFSGIVAWSDSYFCTFTWGSVKGAIWRHRMQSKRIAMRKNGFQLCIFTVHVNAPGTIFRGALDERHRMTIHAWRVGGHTILITSLPIRSLKLKVIEPQ